MKNLNIRPYFDDYEEDKQFYQILFRPAYAIQARELNQLQTILQEQIARHGRNIFKEGAMVIPGQLSIDTNYEYVKLEATFGGSSIDGYLTSLIGQDIEISSTLTGVKAKVSFVQQSTDSTQPTIWVKYISSGTTGTTKKFVPGEQLQTNSSVPLYFTVQNDVSAVGVGSSANIQNGVYFVNDRFVLVEEQTIILDAYTNTPSYKIGLSVEEDFISPEEDSSLYDNAQGSTNYAAPGAHRYFINLKLVKYEVDNSDDKTFIELLRINSGVIASLVTKTEYSILEDALARRTFDESGNYVVNNFGIQIKEHRNNNRGAWTANTLYQVGDVFTVGSVVYVADSDGLSGVLAPTHTIGAASNGGIIARVEKNPIYNQGAFTPENGGSANHIAVAIEPGKAYVQGYEIEKIGTNYVKVPKAQTFKGVRNSTIQTRVGSFVRIQNLYGFLDVTQYPLVEIHDTYTAAGGTAAGTLVGTARARYVEYDNGTIGTTDCQYILSLVDIKMNSGKKFSANARQIFFTNSTGVNFTADVKKDLSILSGAITTASASTSVTGIGTRFTSELNVGDTIGYYSSGTLFANLIVSTISSDTLLTLTANAGIVITNSSAYNVVSTLNEASNDSLVFPLPTQFTRKIKDIDDEGLTNISYYVRQAYTGIVSSGAVIISTSSSSENFASPDQPDAYHVTSTSTGAVVNATTVLNGSSNVATITVGAGLNGTTVGIIATVKKTIKERTKTITRGFSEDFTSLVSASAQQIALSKVDGIQLLKVVEFTNSGGVPVSFGSPIPVGSLEVDITNRYTFSNGAKDAFYDFCTIRNTTSVAPRSPIRIYYDYHEHSSVGDYFTIDSYQKIIPEKFTSSSSKIYNLFDCIDFRPTKLSSGFSSTMVPAIGFDVIADYSYYLSRVDKISLNSIGSFVDAIGAPADAPVAAATPENSMLLYTLSIPPSIIGSPSITISREDNRRYTMRDISTLDKRISSVEYYTSLNLLESQTKNLQLFDNEGNLSFKNGFLVDSLTDQSIANTNSQEFKCSIDVAQGKLRPAFSIENVKFFEKAASNVDRLASGYVVNNNMATLPYTTVPFATQPYASTTVSVTPYIQLNFIGDINLTPSSDEWYESSYKPDIVISQEGNFNAVANQFKAELGTVWNNWQTTWTGTSTSSIDFAVGTTRRGQTIWQSGGTLTSTFENQTRSGVNTYVKAIYDTKTIDDKVINVDIIPFIRSRVISFVAHGLKPDTLVYPFFDQTAISSFVTPSTRISVSSKTGAFDTITNAGSGSDALERSISSSNNNVSTALSIGDIIHNGAAGVLSAATATGIAVLDEDNGVRIVNIKGTFTVGQTIYGNISGVSAVISSVEATPKLISNIYGEVAGTFTIPSSAKLQFRTGSRNFSLSDSITNGIDYTTKAVAIYSAAGYLQTRQRTVLSTRNGVVAKEVVTDNRTITVASLITPPPAIYEDPLAQSFKTEPGNGIFIDSVDLYFSGKDRTLPVNFELREMLNGIPTQNIIPGSRVTVKPSLINVSTDASVVTRIKTQYPIYLDGETEYCFVLSSDSPYYSVWVSQVGQDDVTTGVRITKQPYLGTLFKSQNSHTWDADQLKDIKFIINRCSFNLAAANIKFNNQKLDTIQLQRDSIYTKNASSLIRIRIPNHGFTVGSNVLISGLASTVNGIIPGSINGSRNILYIEQDYVVVNAATNATITGYSNFSDTVYVDKNVKFELANILSSQIQLSNTSIKHFIRSLDTSYNMQSEAQELLPSENTFLNFPTMIASAANEVLYNNSLKSAEIISQLQTTDEKLTPMLDLNRYSLICVGNRIDSNSSAKNVAGLDDLSTSVNSIFSATNKTITASVAGSFSYLKVGQNITISGAANSSNNGTTTVTSIDAAGTVITTTKPTLVNETVTVTVVSSNRWFSEISENGTSEAKYIIKQMNLATPANTLKVYFDLNVNSPASVDVYYRVSANGSSLNGSTWTLIKPLRDAVYNNTPDSYSNMEYNISNSSLFSAAQIKIVMNSTQTNVVPVIKQIRMIATS